MAGERDSRVVQAYRVMHARGVDTISIATAIGTSRAYVSRAICGYERRGRVWQRIRAVLQEQAPEALALLEQVECEALPVQDTTFRARSQSHQDSAGSSCHRGQEERGAEPSGVSVAPVNLARPMICAFTTWRQQTA